MGYKGNNNNYYNNNHKNKYNRQNEKNDDIAMLQSRLSIEYADHSKIFLESGVAYKIAEKMGGIPPHQLRKILNEIKLASNIVRNDKTKFDDARNKLFYVVPLTAYNAGRNKNLQGLYAFVKSHINKDTIKGPEDIETLDKLFTSIIAYHKYFQIKKEG